MAKKKKSRRARHQATSTPVASAKEVPATVIAEAPTPEKSGISATRWAYVGSDMRRITWLVGGCILLELLLWYVFAYTSVGASAYEWVKI